MTTRLVIVVGLGLLLFAPLPAAADHDTTPPLERRALSEALTPERSTTVEAPATERGATLDVPGTETSIDINLKLGLNGFRLGGRLFGREGYAGGLWLNGETRRDGFSLDGRLERDGKAHNFKFNADIDEWLRRAFRWWGAQDL